MLGSCENMIEEKALNPSSDPIMEKPAPIDQSPKCPRCDSSNTKFCYYNNYSLSQPRHFCKACKRYWTRGGTLRNVPIGGGCRKNKRVKRPSSSDAQSTPPTYFPTQIDVSNTANETSPLFYGLPTTNSNMNLAYSNFRSSITDSNSENLPISCAPYDLWPQMNALRLSFPSSMTASKERSDEEFPVGYSPSTTSLLPDYSLFGSGSSSSNTSSLNTSSLQQQHNHLLGLKDNQPTNDLQVFFPYQDLQIMGNANSRVLKGVKTEEFSNDRSNKMDWYVHRENPIESIGGDSSLFWNTTMGTWSDSTNFAPYVSPLI